MGKSRLNRDKSKSKPKRSSENGPILIIIGCAVLLIIGVGLYAIFGRGGSRSGDQHASQPAATPQTPSQTVQPQPANSHSSAIGSAVTTQQAPSAQPGTAPAQPPAAVGLQPVSPSPEGEQLGETAAVIAKNSEDLPPGTKLLSARTRWSESMKIDKSAAEKGVVELVIDRGVRNSQYGITAYRARM